MSIKNLINLKPGFKIVPALLILLASCTTHRQLVYLSTDDPAGTDEFFPGSQPEYRIQNRDILYIKVYSLNEEISNLINQNQGSTQQNLYQNESSLYINGYNVNDSGYVEVPLLGKIQVAGKTMNEVTSSISLRTGEYLKDATVIVKLLSFKFSVLGEVNRPGTYTNFNTMLTVLEAISMAGDINDYGNRRKILVLRPGNNGTTTMQLDLTKRELLSSNAFYLLPNDIVYVEPVRNKSFRINSATYSLVFTSVSTLILVLNFLGR